MGQVGLSCQWRKSHDAPECGKPADAFRAWLDDGVWRSRCYCKRHKALLAPDAEARKQGVETVAVGA